MRGSTPNGTRVPQVAVLSHQQPIGSRTSTFIPRDVADGLVQRMAAERLSQGVIRMMPPSSIFLPAVKSALPQVKYVPMKLPPVEVENCKFVRPTSDVRPSLASIRAGWNWSREPWPAELISLHA